ncbi:MAG: hypothetical protein H6983_04610 [Ectothiorhodospiraceae bacterium]|nr:hypothetical protein [Ectothiorhodospiraceae bacterium]
MSRRLGLGVAAGTAMLVALVVTLTMQERQRDAEERMSALLAAPLDAPAAIAALDAVDATLAERALTSLALDQALARALAGADAGGVDRLLAGLEALGAERGHRLVAGPAVTAALEVALDRAGNVAPGSDPSAGVESAARRLARASPYLPAAVRQRLATGLERQRAEWLDAVARPLRDHLGTESPARGSWATLVEAVQAVRDADPLHPLLTDRRLHRHLDAALEAATDDGDVAAARAIARAVGDLPSPPTELAARANVAAQVAAERAEARRTEAAVQAVEALVAGASSLDAYRAARDALVVVALGAPRTPALARARFEIGQFLGAAVAAALHARQPRAARAAILEFAAVLDAEPLLAWRRQLVDADPDYSAVADPAHAPRITAAAKAVNRLLARPTLDARWRAELAQAFGEYVVLAPGDADGAIETVRGAVATLHEDRAEAAIGSGDRATALEALAESRRYVRDRTRAMALEQRAAALSR